MSTIAELRLSATDTALEGTFESAPEATVRLESAVSNSVPCLWIEDVDRRTIAEAFAADPEVESTRLLVETDERLLYDVTFTEAVTRTCETLLAEGGTVLDAWGSSGWWHLRMRFDAREDLARTHDRLSEIGIRADVRRVSELTDEAIAHTRLTPQQREALAAAFERGYFEIPREVSMEELAGELEISHQALSERLRRAYETLVDAELEVTGGRQRGQGRDASRSSNEHTR